MPGGTGLLNFKKAFPKRLFDVGIAEEHAVSMAGGLAKQGMIPVVAIYSTFLQRSFDQIMQDVALLKLHVVFAVDRAGLVGEDGATHHGVFDVGFLRQIPGMMLLAPASGRELRDMLRWAVEDYDGPVAIRYPRGGDGTYTASAWDANATVITHRTGEWVALVAYGTMINSALDAADVLKNEGFNAAVLRLTRLNPLPEDALETALAGFEYVFIMEDTCTHSGLGEALVSMLHSRAPGCDMHILDLGDDFVAHGSVKQLHQQFGLDGASIANYIKEVLMDEN